MAKRQKIRLDEALLQAGLCISLVEARALILAGKVLVDGQRLDKAGSQVLGSAKIALKGQKKYVSRAGEKLESALLAFNLTAEIKDQVAIDIGASTGGFTDCLLKLGAKEVLAVDVGTHQFSDALRKDPRISLYEKTDIRDFKLPHNKQVDWIFSDISFNSLARLAKAIVSLGQSHTRYLLLVKPQFELEREEVPYGGVVTEPSLRSLAVSRVSKAYQELGLSYLGHCDSKIAGRKGNVEIFLYLGPLGVRQS